MSKKILVHVRTKSSDNERVLVFNTIHEARAFIADEVNKILVHQINKAEVGSMVGRSSLYLPTYTIRESEN